MPEIVGTNVIASRPPERRPTAMPIACANFISSLGLWLLLDSYYCKIEYERRGVNTNWQGQSYRAKASTWCSHSCSQSPPPSPAGRSGGRRQHQTQCRLWLRWRRWRPRRAPWWWWRSPPTMSQCSSPHWLPPTVWLVVTREGGWVDQRTDVGTCTTQYLTLNHTILYHTNTPSPHKGALKYYISRFSPNFGPPPPPPPLPNLLM